MINKEAIKMYSIRKCPKLAYLMCNESGVLKIIKSMIEGNIDDEDILEKIEADDESIKEENIDTIYELIRSFPNLYNEIKKEISNSYNDDYVTNFINEMKNYQEVSNLSRLYAIEMFGSNVYRADTVDGSVDGIEETVSKKIEENTQKLLKNPKVKVILEGQVSNDKYLARWDIAVKTPGGLQIYEVKGTNKIYRPKTKKSNNQVIVVIGEPKKQYLYDLAFQYDVYKNCGLKIEGLSFICLNPNFKLKKEEMSYPIDKEYLKDLFVIYNNVYISAEKEEFSFLDYFENKMYINQKGNRDYPDLEELKIKVEEAAYSKKEPPTYLMYECRKSQGCIMKNICHPKIDDNHIFTLTNNMKNGGNYATTQSLIESGVYKINEIPHEIVQEKYPLIKKRNSDGLNYKSIARMQIECAKNHYSGINFIEKKYLRELLGKDYAIYPLIFFDFETFSYPIPLVGNQRPWEQICCQYSMHVVEKDYDLDKHDFASGKGGGISHYEFIGHPFLDGYKNPEQDLLLTFKNQLEQENVDYKNGNFTLIVYNKSFETTQFKRMGEKYPQFSELCNISAERIVDLLDFFQYGWWYRKDFNGRNSLKVTQPNIIKDEKIYSWYKDLSYDLKSTLDYKQGKVHNGGVALDVYQTLLRKNALKKLDKEEHDEFIKALLAYCKIDSWGTVILYDTIKKLDDKVDDINSDIGIDDMNLIDEYNR